MQLLVQDVYTDRLAGFLESLGHGTLVIEPGSVELTDPRFGGEVPPEAELRIVLRVWSALYPDAEVTLVAD